MSEVTSRPIYSDPLSRRFRDALPPRAVLALAAVVALLIPGLLLHFPMPYVIAGVIGLLALAAILAWPYVGLLVFLALLYVRPEEIYPELAGARFALTISVTVLFAWLINAFLCRERFRLGLPAVQCLLGFVIVAVVSTAYCGATDLVDEALDLWRLLILFVLIVHLVNTEGRLQWTVGAVVLFSAILGARTIWEYQHGDVLIDDGTARALGTGIFGDPNDLALAMTMALPLALGVAFSRGGWWTRLWHLGTVPIFLWTIFVTNSRGGVMALAATVLVFFSRRMGRIGLILGAVAAMAVFTLGPSRMSQMSSDEDSAHERVVAWQAGLDMLHSSPLLGVGKGQFTEHHYRTAHNSVVLCFGELGLIGTALWLGLFYFAFRDGKQIAPDPSAPAPEAPPAGRAPPLKVPYWQYRLLQVSLIAFLVGGFFLSRTYTAPLYVYLGLTAAAAQIGADQQEKELPRASQRDWRNVALLTLGAYLLVRLCVRLWS